MELCEIKWFLVSTDKTNSVKVYDSTDWVFGVVDRNNTKQMCVASTANIIEVIINGTQQWWWQRVHTSMLNFRCDIHANLGWVLQHCINNGDNAHGHTN